MCPTHSLRFHMLRTLASSLDCRDLLGHFRRFIGDRCQRAGRLDCMASPQDKILVAIDGPRSIHHPIILMIKLNASESLKKAPPLPANRATEDAPALAA